MAHIRKIKNKKGISYKVDIRKEGYNPIYATFKGDDAESRAKKWAKTIEKQMDLGIYKEYTRNEFNIKTLADLINYFDKEVALSKYSHYEKYKVMYTWWKNQIGNIKLPELTTSILTDCKNRLKNEKILKGKNEVTRSANTINKYLMCLSAVLSYAVNELEIIDLNPMNKVKLMPKPNSRTRFMSDDEIDSLSSACKNYSPMIFCFWLLLFKTGGRFSEVKYLQVKDIDKKNKRVYFLDTKNKTHRSVYIGNYALEVLETYLSDNNIESGYVFRAKRKNAELATLKGAMEECIKRAGLEDFHIHDIRHTTASILAQEGASLLEIAEILGQKSLTVARLYSHLTKKHTEELLASVMDKYTF